MHAVTQPCLVHSTAQSPAPTHLPHQAAKAFACVVLALGARPRGFGADLAHAQRLQAPAVGLV